MGPLVSTAFSQMREKTFTNPSQWAHGTLKFPCLNAFYQIRAPVDNCDAVRNARERRCLRRIKLGLSASKIDASLHSAGFRRHPEAVFVDVTRMIAL
jgi:hypothetical protein